MKYTLMLLFLLFSLTVGECKVSDKKYKKITEQTTTQIYPCNMKRNNPFNIRVGNNWQGEKDVPEQAFEQFEELDYGLRAGYKLLRNYATNYSLTTIEQIIYRFAPPCENDTENYIRVVCKLTGYTRDKQLNLWDRKVLLKLADAMIYMEQGVHINPLDRAYKRFFT